MKLNKFGWLAVITAGALLLNSCSNLSSSTLEGTVNDNSGSSVGEVPISLTLSDIGEDGTFSRTILPVALQTSGISYYTLSGQSQYSSFADEIISGTNATNLANGTGYKRNFTSTYWHLTIKAYKFAGTNTTPAPATDNLLLQGTADIDLSTSTQTTLQFKLSSYKVTTNGFYDLLLNYTTPAEWNAEKYSMKYGLYDIQTGEVVVTGSTTEESAPSTAGLAVAVEEDAAGTWTASDGTTKYKGGQNITTKSTTGVAPGSYTLGVTIYNSTSSYTSDTEIGYFSDVILIEPGQTTKQIVNMGAILGTVPAAPTNLGVQRIIGSETDGYYNARFYWTDNSNNEKYFKLVIKEYNSTASDATGYTPASPLVTTGDNVTDGLVLDYQVFKETSGDIRYEAGSLFSGSRELVLKLPTGRLFDAEIYAVNSLGESDSNSETAGNQGCSRVNSVSTTETLTTVASGAVPTQTTTGISSISGKKVAGYKITNTVEGEVTAVAEGGTETTTDKEVAVRVNLAQISYNLNGGTLKIGDVTQTVKTYVDYQVYELDTAYTAPSGHSYPQFANIALLDIANNASYTLSRSVGTETFNWSSWLDSASAKVTHTNLYNDLTVIAGYANNDLTLTISIAEIPELANDQVFARYGSTSGTSYVASTGTDCKNFNLMALTEQFITVSVSATASANFKKFSLVIDGTVLDEKKAGSGTSGTTVFSNVSTSATPSLQESGVHTVNVIGLMADGRYFSNTFTIDVRR